MLLLFEGIVMCFILVMYCIIGIRNGAVGLVCLYEDDVQERVIELELVTKGQIKKQFLVSAVVLFIPLFTLVPYMVYVVNGVTEFKEGFIQMTIILMIMGLFDRFFIDWYWVGHTKAWIIPGTEDLQPYIPVKVLIRKWLGTLIAYPLLALLMAKIVSILI
ncbi:MAG: hypothetical protein IKM20_01030 [Erysipelotrichales bacterium]|nr:hypothetical protein [Erysipelotrichales bacterium]